MKRDYKYLYIVSALMLLTGCAMGLKGNIAFHLIYLLGAVGYVAYYLLSPTSDLPIRTVRLVRMNVLAGLLFILSAVARFGVFDAWGRQLWILFLALGVVFALYANLVLSITTSSKKKNEK